MNYVPDHVGAQAESDDCQLDLPTLTSLPTYDTDKIHSTTEVEHL